MKNTLRKKKINKGCINKSAGDGDINFNIGDEKEFTANSISPSSFTHLINSC